MSKAVLQLTSYPPGVFKCPCKPLAILLWSSANDGPVLRRQSTQGIPSNSWTAKSLIVRTLRCLDTAQSKVLLSTNLVTLRPTSGFRFPRPLFWAAGGGLCQSAPPQNWDRPGQPMIVAISAWRAFPLVTIISKLFPAPLLTPSLQGDSRSHSSQERRRLPALD